MAKKGVKATGVKEIIDVLKAFENVADNVASHDGQVVVENSQIIDGDMSVGGPRLSPNEDDAVAEFNYNMAKQGGDVDINDEIIAKFIRDFIEQKIFGG
jgi:hypothetical protein